MLTKKINFRLNRSLYILDYIHKYNLQTIYYTPSIKKIKFTIFGNFNKKNDNYYKTSFYLYLLTYIFPQITASENSSVYINKELGFFILTVNISNKKEIESFLEVFFFDMCTHINFRNSFSNKKFVNFFLCTLKLSDFFEISSLNKLFIESNDFVTIRINFSSVSKKYSYKFLPSFWLL